MRIAFIILLTLTALVGAAACQLGFFAHIGTIQVMAMDGAPSASRNWQDVFAHPIDVKVTAFVTGWVEAGPEILIDKTNPRTPAAYKQRIWVPSVAYLVEHPTKGRILLDTGLKAGDCAYGNRPVYWVPCRNERGSDAVSELTSLNLKPSDLSFIVVSHFHGDHVSGLANLIRGGATRIATTAVEIDDVKSDMRALSGYEHSMLRENFTALTADHLMTAMPIVGRAADIFGDGSVWLIPTPGHTRGQLSALINAKSGALLLTFDASHLKAGFDLNIIPGAYVDRPAAERSLANLRALSANYPQIKVIHGHEPSEWQGKTREVIAGS